VEDLRGRKEKIISDSLAWPGHAKVPKQDFNFLVPWDMRENSKAERERERESKVKSRKFYLSKVYSNELV
jgi:hypothetical protein